MHRISSSEELRYELRSSPDAGDLGSHASVRPGLRALPRLRPIRAEPDELTTEQGYRLLDEIRSLRRAADGLHRRRSAEAAGPYDLIRYA